jgi:hypothetical protein
VLCTGNAEGREDTPMMDEDRDALLARLNTLRSEHRDLDTVIARLAGDTMADQIHLARLKKRKLKLKDEITWIEDRLIPNIIA